MAHILAPQPVEERDRGVGRVGPANGAGLEPEPVEGAVGSLTTAPARRLVRSSSEKAIPSVRLGGVTRSGLLGFDLLESVEQLVVRSTPGS